MEEQTHAVQGVLYAYYTYCLHGNMKLIIMLALLNVLLFRMFIFFSKRMIFLH